MWKYKTIRAVFTGLFVLSVFLVAYLHITSVWPKVFLVSLICVWFTYIIVGVFRMRAQVFLPSVCSLAIPGKKNILLTFDDGPHPQITPLILDTLAAHKAKAVFFCIGKKLALYPQLAARMVAEGHIIANHSYNHSNLIGMYSTQRVVEEIRQTEAEIERITPSLKLYRPPFGVTNPNIAKATSALNMKVIGWNTRSFDTVSRSGEKVLSRITANLKNGDIILFHDTQEVTSTILADFLLFVRNKGFTFDIDSLK